MAKIHDVTDSDNSAQFRSLNDFLLSQSRYEAPYISNWTDFKKWMSKIQTNIIYYQRNYTLVFIIIFIIYRFTFCSSVSPTKMLSTWALVTGGVFAFTRHPLISSATLFLGHNFIVHYLGDGFSVYKNVVTIWIVATFIHASLRKPHFPVINIPNNQSQRTIATAKKVGKRRISTNIIAN